MKFFIVISALLAVSFAVDLDGQCQPVQPVQDFNVPKYAGLWYEVYRYETEFQPGGECVTAQYTINQWGNVTVLNSMVVKNMLFTIEGTAAASDDGTGKLRVWFPIDQPGNTGFNYWVLSTDYDNYALVHSCANLPNNKKRIMSWILSREKYLKPQSVIAMNPALEAADGLNWDNYKFTDHKESTCTTKS